MTGMQEFELHPFGPRWLRRGLPWFFIVAAAFYLVSAVAGFSETGLSLPVISSLVGITLFGFQAWFWWHLARTYPFLRINDDSIEYRHVGATDVQIVPLGQIQRLTFAGGNAIFKLPGENQVHVPYTRRTFELTQEAKSKLASWAKAHGIEVVG